MIAQRVPEKKANCLMAVFPNFFQYLGCALRTRNHEKHLEVRKDRKANALTSVLSDSMTLTPVRLGDIGRDSQGYRVYSVKGKSVSLSANSGGFGGKTGLYRIDLPDGDYFVRKLTPLECERLQTLPDNYTIGVSNSQRYKAIGNGWTVDVLAHLLKKIPYAVWIKSGYHDNIEWRIKK